LRQPRPSSKSDAQAASVAGHETFQFGQAGGEKIHWRSASPANALKANLFTPGKINVHGESHKSP
jgi:hypothetical protein